MLCYMDFVVFFLYISTIWELNGFHIPRNSTLCPLKRNAETSQDRSIAHSLLYKENYRCFHWCHYSQTTLFPIDWMCFVDKLNIFATSCHPYYLSVTEQGDFPGLCWWNMRACPKGMKLMIFITTKWYKLFF